MKAMLAEVDRARNFEDLSFIHVAFCELVECREFLKNSYVLGYYRYARARKRQAGKTRSRIARALESEKETFEEMQAELEMITETLSDIVARKHMRASKVRGRIWKSEKHNTTPYLTTYDLPQSQVIAATNAATEKRSEINVRQIGVLAEVRAEMEAKIIAERGKVDRSAAGPSGNTLPERRAMYDDGERSFDDGNDNSSEIQSLGSDDLGAMMTAILEVASGGGNPEVLTQTSRNSSRSSETTRTRGSRHNPRNLSEQQMLERAIQQSLAEERVREMSRPSPPSSPPNEAVEFYGESEEFEDDEPAATARTPTTAASISLNDEIVLEPFQCTACTFFNEYGDACSLCNTPRPKTVEGETTDRALLTQPPPPNAGEEIHREHDTPLPSCSPLKYDANSILPDDEPWSCSVCTLINDPSVTSCVACDTSRVFVQGTKRPSQLPPPPPPPLPSSVPCDTCGKPFARFRCSNCKMTYYCGRECQLKGWKEHRQLCHYAKAEDERGNEEGETMEKEKVEEGGEDVTQGYAGEQEDMTFLPLQDHAGEQEDMTFLPLEDQGQIQNLDENNDNSYDSGEDLGSPKSVDTDGYDGAE